MTDTVAPDPAEAVVVVVAPPSFTLVRTRVQKLLLRHSEQALYLTPTLEATTNKAEAARMRLVPRAGDDYFLRVNDVEVEIFVNDTERLMVRHGALATVGPGVVDVLRREVVPDRASTYLWLHDPNAQRPTCGQPFLLCAQGESLLPTRPGYVNHTLNWLDLPTTADGVKALSDTWIFEMDV